MSQLSQSSKLLQVNTVVETGQPESITYDESELALFTNELIELGVPEPEINKILK